MSENQPLPAERYLDPVQFERDRERVFHRSWQCVCHLSELATTGDFVTFDIAGESVFVTRDQQGQLQAFYNLCRHRGHPLLEGVGNTGKRMVCPYHAWCYDLEGRLINAPAASEAELEICRTLRLQAIRIEVFCGFVFVNLDDDAKPVAETYPEVESRFRSFHAAPENLQFVCETSIEHQCNWKISIENYNECYHCPTVHGSSLTRGVLDMDGYSVQPKGAMIWHHGQAQQNNEKQYEYDTGHSARAGEYAAFWFWPNVSFCCYPGGYFTIRQWLPLNARQTIYRYRWFSDGKLAPTDVEALMVKHRETTGAEDEVVVRKIQKAMESRAFHPGPYIIGDTDNALSEIGVQHFHHLYREAVDGR